MLHELLPPPPPHTYQPDVACPVKITTRTSALGVIRYRSGKETWAWFVPGTQLPAAQPENQS